MLLNTPLDDWGLSFISAKEAIGKIFSDTSKLQVMRFVKFRSAETATALNGLSTGIRGSSGNITTRGRIAFAVFYQKVI